MERALGVQLALADLQAAKLGALAEGVLDPVFGGAGEQRGLGEGGGEALRRRDQGAPVGGAQEERERVAFPGQGPLGGDHLVLPLEDRPGVVQPIDRRQIPPIHAGGQARVPLHRASQELLGDLEAATGSDPGPVALGREAGELQALLGDPRLRAGDAKLRHLDRRASPVDGAIPQDG